MPIRRLSPKSQTMLPEAVREASNLKEGDESEYYYLEDRRAVLVKADSLPVEDPFVNFTEWGSDADHEGYDKL